MSLSTTHSSKSHHSSDVSRRSFLATAGAAAGVAALGFAAPAAMGRSWQSGTGKGPVESPFDWVEVRPGCFATTNDATGGNCLAVAGGGALLVDTKFPAFAPQIARDVRALTGSPVERVINTHHHGDHTGGNEGFSKDATIITHANAKPRIRAQYEHFMQGINRGQRTVGRLEERYRAAIMDDIAGLLKNAEALKPESWMPTTTVGNGRTGFDLGGEWIEIVHFGRPSHTDNDVIVHLKGSNVIHTGDVVFSGVSPFFDVNGGADSAEWIETLADIAALCDKDTVVVPGHGAVGGVEIVRAQSRYIEQLRESVQKAIDAGTSLDELRPTVFPFMEGLGFEGLRKNGIEFVYNELIAG